MKIILSHSTKLPWKEEVYNALRNSSLSKENEIFFPQKKVTEEKITKDLIKESDVILAEVSYPSTGQGIELGWANILNISIICFYKEGNKISSSLKYITDTFVVYSSMDDMIQKVYRQINGKN